MGVSVRAVHILDVLMARSASLSRTNGIKSTSVCGVFVALLFAIIGMQNGTDDASPASPRARHENSQTSHGEFSSTKSTADKCSDMANSYRSVWTPKIHPTAELLIINSLTQWSHTDTAWTKAEKHAPRSGRRNLSSMRISRLEQRRCPVCPIK